MKKYINYLIGFTCIIISTICSALPTDPTRPNFSLLGTAAVTATTKTASSQINLQAIMFNNQQKFAIINNKSYKEQQWLNADTQVIKITPQAVTLNKSGEKQTINLQSVQVKTASKLDGH
ncbi:hypothetical protein DS2_15949 [Catenovulum agarivorans DS-2]|uniref:Lipoprotein n=1 Tax=Catenovulum agarivorans DS-2 TaxID=1328313 RepID=W7QIJ0_9ALTE|nr:GspB domain-containing protein [Catenovulum agarivorans]EWH08742.1 hypothetical protein DS2_15949 [Catenovulum agarivorans DS-2]